MDKQDWLDFIRVISEKDAFDYITLVVEIVSPILLLISIIVSFKAAQASKESVEVSKQVYEDQRHERELSFLPLFKVAMYTNYVERMDFKLENKNDKEIHLQNVVSESPHRIKFFDEESNNIFFFDIFGKGKYQNEDYIKIWLYYTTLDHKNYCTILILQIFNGSLVVKEQYYERIEKNILVPQL